MHFEFMGIIAYEYLSRIICMVLYYMHASIFNFKNFVNFFISFWNAVWTLLHRRTVVRCSYFNLCHRNSAKNFENSQFGPICSHAHVQELHLLDTVPRRQIPRHNRFESKFQADSERNLMCLIPQSLLFALELIDDLLHVGVSLGVEERQVLDLRHYRV